MQILAQVHVFWGENVDAASCAQDHISGVRAALTATGMQLCSQKEPDATARFHVMQVGNWLTVSDQSSGTHDSDDTAFELALTLSSIFERPTLLVLHSRDGEFAILLFELGRIVDGYTTESQFIRRRFPTLPSELREKEWSRILQREFREGELNAALAHAGLPLDAPVQHLLSLLGIDVASQVVQAQGPHVPHDAIPLSAECWIHTRSTAQPLKTSPDLFGNKASNAFTPTEDQSVIRLLKGEEHLISVELSLENAGMNKPLLRFAGSAINQGMLSIGRVTGLWFRDGNSAQREIILSEAVVDIQHDWSESGAVIEVRLVVSEDHRFAVTNASGILLSFALNATFDGEGDLSIEYQPHSQFCENRSILGRSSVYITTPCWVPLGVRPSRAVARLNTPRVTFAVAILPDESTAASSAIERAAIDWLTLHGVEGKVDLSYEGLVDSANFEVPRRELSLTQDSSFETEWRRFVGDPAMLQSLFCTIRSRDGELQRGVSIHRADAAVNETVHVAFWAATPVAELDKNRMRDALATTVDFLAATCGIIQGFIAAWDWIPRFSTGSFNGYTPYEDAYQVGRSTEMKFDLNGGFLSRSWCEMTLRGIGETIWLGSALQNQLAHGTRNCVAETCVGDAVRWDLAAEHTLRDMENLMASILLRRFILT